MDEVERVTEAEIDPYTGKLKKVELKQNTIIQSSLNRNLLYTKAEIDAQFNALPRITVSSTAPANPRLNDLWVDIS